MLTFTYLQLFLIIYPLIGLFSFLFDIISDMSYCEDSNSIGEYLTPKIAYLLSLFCFIIGWPLLLIFGIHEVKISLSKNNLCKSKQ